MFFQHHYSFLAPVRQTKASISSTKQSINQLDKNCHVAHGVYLITFFVCCFLRATKVNNNTTPAKTTQPIIYNYTNTTMALHFSTSYFSVLASPFFLPWVNIACYKQVSALVLDCSFLQSLLLPN